MCKTYAEVDCEKIALGFKIGLVFFLSYLKKKNPGKVLLCIVISFDLLSHIKCFG